MEEYISIQQELKAPKDNSNSKIKYSYRSCEGILEKLKPILSKHKCTINLSDEIISVGNRIYVKATATLKNSQGEIESATGLSRESENSRTGMDQSQITGSTSSYARKYSLNGLLAIDDNKDSDSTNDHEPFNEEGFKHFQEYVQRAIKFLGDVGHDLLDTHGSWNRGVNDREFFGFLSEEKILKIFSELKLAGSMKKFTDDVSKYEEGIISLAMAQYNKGKYRGLFEIPEASRPKFIDLLEKLKGVE